MATYRGHMRSGNPYRMPWHARVKVDHIDFSLGYYETEEEAIQVENEFRLRLTGKAQNRLRKHASVSSADVNCPT